MSETADRDRRREVAKQALDTSGFPGIEDDPYWLCNLKRRVNTDDMHSMAEKLRQDAAVIEEAAEKIDGPLAQTRGVIGRYPEADERYVFDFDQTKPRPIHMLGVRRPLLVRWLVDGDLVAEQTLRPWIGHARHRADTVTEERP